MKSPNLLTRIKSNLMQSIFRYANNSLKNSVKLDSKGEIIINTKICSIRFKKIFDKNIQ